VNIVGWVWTENFPHYLRFLASLTHYDLPDEQVAAIVASLHGSNAEDGCWREYVMPGSPAIGMSLAYEVGFDNVQIQFDCDDLLGLRAEAALDIMSRYSLRKKVAGSSPTPNWDVSPPDR
jgi:hypothetical protein